MCGPVDAEHIKVELEGGVVTEVTYPQGYTGPSVVVYDYDTEMYDEDDEGQTQDDDGTPVVVVEWEVGSGS